MITVKEIIENIARSFREGTCFPDVYRQHLSESIDSDVMQVIIEAAAVAAYDVIEPAMQRMQIVTPTSNGRWNLKTSFGDPITSKGIQFRATSGHVIEMRDDV